MFWRIVIIKRWNAGFWLGLPWSDQRIWRSRRVFWLGRICGSLTSSRATNSGLGGRRTFWKSGACLPWCVSIAQAISTLIAFPSRTAPLPTSRISKCLTRYYSKWKNSSCIAIWTEKACSECWADRCKTGAKATQQLSVKFSGRCWSWFLLQLSSKRMMQTTTVYSTHHLISRISMRKATNIIHF